MNGKTRYAASGAFVILLMMISMVAVAQDAAVETLAPVVEKEYMGRPISLDVQEAEISTVLRSLAGFSGVNIVSSPRVVGKVTVSWKKCPGKRL
jgi:type II secretory pathway component HofQ